MESHPLPADADGRQCRAWADSHPAASCKTDREILNHLGFLWTRKQGADRFCQISNEKLADQIGAKKRAVIYRLKKLEARGAFIRKTEYGERGEQRANQFVFPDESCTPPHAKVAPPPMQKLHPPHAKVAPPTRASEEEEKQRYRSEDRESCIQDHKIQLAEGGIERSENPPQTPPFENGKSKPYEHPARHPGESQAAYDARLFEALKLQHAR